MQNKELCIIVVTYNASKWIDKCFGEFVDMPANWQILAIDNNSDDNCVELINKKYPFVKTIKNNKNLGFGMANNIGLKFALEKGFEHVFLLNQDAWISVENLKKLITIQKQHPNYYILSPIHCNGSTDELDKGFFNYAKTLTEPALVEDAILGTFKKEVYDTKFVNAALWLISKECLNIIGGFSPVFYHYGEDSNYIHRVIYHNKKIGIVPNIMGFHKRNNRPPSKIFHVQKQIQYRELLIKLSNPQNDSIIKQLKILTKTVLYSLKYILGLKLVKSYSYCYAILKALPKIKEINKNRKLSKNKGACFLN